MFKLIKWSFLIVLIAGIFTYPGGISGILETIKGNNLEPLRGYVVLAGDGDTISVMSREHKGYMIRLAGVNAPELGQCYGIKAQKYAQKQVGRKNVRVKADLTHPLDKNSKQKYPRIFGYIYYKNGTNFNVELVRKGYAKLYFYKGKQPKLYRALKKAEDEAKVAQRGIWNPKSC